MKGFRILSVVLFSFFIGTVSAQETAEAQQGLSLDNGSINSQFEFVYKKSGNYRADGKRYEVVRTISLDKLRQNVLDSLKGFKSNAVDLKTTIAGHESTISSLNEKL